MRSHEQVKHIRIRNRLNHLCMRTVRSAVPAPELMNYSGQHSVVQR
ncbi:hypothetical protein GVO84_00430 [Enterobacter sp. SM3]|nr:MULTISPECIES: hypothetical protein [Enterobacter]